MRRFSFALSVLILLPAALVAQQNEAGAPAPAKFALVIGNANYSGLTPLANPVNDANGIAAVLEYLGFTVDKILNGNQEQMENAITRLKNRLSGAENAYGFFFYAGHGVQSGGENFLIPVDANIPGENYLRNRAVSVQTVLDDLNDARNGLNVVVLDACRDNPFGWSRSGSRGLSVVSRQPADSIIVYATSAGARASDGDGRNGLFTSQLINNLATPGLEVKEVFNRTGAEVARASNNEQVPAIYSQFFGTAFLGDVPADYQGYIAGGPGTTVIIGGSDAKEPQSSKFWSIGGSAGTSFTEPWVVGTIRGTVAPLKYTFFEAGFNVGMVSSRKNVTSYYSLGPYLHVAFFWPFNEVISAYTGAGLGYRMSRYEYYGNDITISSLPIDASAGILLFNFMEIYYTLSYSMWNQANSDTIIGQTLLNNISGMISNKFAVGYVYRF